MGLLLGFIAVAVRTGRSWLKSASKKPYALTPVTQPCLADHPTASIRADLFVVGRTCLTESSIN